MSVTVRRARYESESDEVVELLQANLPYRVHARYFNWLYRQNPAGEALAWVAVDSSTHRIVGAAAAFPRTVFFSGRKARGYVLGDFCIHRTHRSLGSALALQRACLDGLSADNGEFAFDFPSKSMVAVYNRLRIAIDDSVVRYVKLLRADFAIARRVRNRAAARVLSGIANAGLRELEVFVRGNRGWTVSVAPAPWGSEFSEAAWKWTPASAITVARTTEYLNWRYAAHPQHRYEMVAARKNGILGGYMLRHETDAGFVIDDLLAGDTSAYGALLSEAIATGRSHKAQSIVTPWPVNDPGRHVLERFGFRSRGSSPAVLLRLSQAGGQCSACSLFHADWEV
jgi:hypothetical protein